MQLLFNIINTPLGKVMEFIASITGNNFAVAVFVFTLLINVILIPLSIKSQKSSVQQTRIKPKLDELKKQCGDDKQKYSQEMQKLYQEENVSMSGGCLPMIIRLVLMLSIYYLIMSPLTYMTGVDKTKLDNVTNVITQSMDDLKKEDKTQYEQYKKLLNWREGKGYNELGVVSIIRNEKNVLYKEDGSGLLTKEEYKKIEKDLEFIKKQDEENKISYNFFTKKIDLTQTPKFSFNIFKAWQPIWIMPILAFAAQMLSSVLSLMMQKKLNPDAPNMAGMMLMMPLMSLFIGFSLPGGVAFYWVCSSLIGGLIQVGVQQFYGPNKMLARDRVKELAKQCDFEAGQIKKIDAANESELNGEKN